MKKLTKKTVRAAKEKFPSLRRVEILGKYITREQVKSSVKELIGTKNITADDIVANCADCPKPIKREPMFSKFEIASLALIGVLAYSWFVSDWLASL